MTQRKAWKIACTDGMKRVPATPKRSFLFDFHARNVSTFMVMALSSIYTFEKSFSLALSLRSLSSISLFRTLFTQNSSIVRYMGAAVAAAVDAVKAYNCLLWCVMCACKIKSHNFRKIYVHLVSRSVKMLSPQSKQARFFLSNFFLLTIDCTDER